jgi:DNA-binding MarR family transcriptional regulator
MYEWTQGSPRRRGARHLRVVPPARADGLSVLAPSISDLDGFLELLERRGLSPTELRVLLAVRDRGLRVEQLAEALSLRPTEVNRAGRRLVIRGLVHRHRVRRRSEATLEPTPAGLATARTFAAAAERMAPSLPPV